MEDMFISLLNMSLTASYVIAAIMLARLFLKRAPKSISYALWVVAGFRLVFPFSFESAFSLIPFKSAPIPADIAMQPTPRIDSGIIIVDNVVSRVLPGATPAASVNPLQIWQAVGAYLWFAGCIVMLLYSVVSIILLKRQLRGAELAEGNIYEAKNLKTPFVLGFIRPKIYIPTGLSAEEKSCIILHEQTHIKRIDHVLKFAAFLILCVHWFNPLVWVAFVYFVKDMEMSCDERVLKEMGGDIKQAYSTYLLSLAAGRRLINGSPLAFGEGNIKERIKNVLNFKKPAVWVVAAATALVVALSIGFALNRETVDPNQTGFPEYAVTDNKELNVIELSRDGIVFRPYGGMPDNTLRGKQIGIRKNDPQSKICEVKGYQADEWIIEYLDVFTGGGNMLFKAIDVTEIPAALEQYNIYEQKSNPILAPLPSPAAETGKTSGVNFFVTTSPGKYTPAMSSTPGLRLDITYDGPTAHILYEAKTGSFITWVNSVITDLGNSVTRRADATALYWRPNFDTLQDDIVTLTILNEAGEKIAGSAFAITKGDDGFYTAFSKSPKNVDPSAETETWEVISRAFAEAFFEKNTEIMKSYLVDPDENFDEPILKSSFSDVESMKLKFNLDNIKSDSVSAQYEFKFDGDDSYTYLQLNMKKVNGVWKVEFYGLEK